MLEQKINSLAMENYGAAALPTSLFTVNQRSSELARRLNARITVHGLSSNGAAGNALNWSMSSRGNIVQQNGSVHVVDRRALQAVQTAVNTTLRTWLSFFPLHAPGPRCLLVHVFSASLFFYVRHV